MSARTKPVAAWMTLAAIALILGAGRGWAESLDPGAYLEASREAVSLPRVIAGYNAYVDRQEPWIYGVFDIDLLSEPSLLPSVDGNLDGRFMGIDGFFCARFPGIGGYSLRALFLPSFFAFAFDRSSASFDEAIYGSETNLGWISGYALFGLQLRRGLDRMTLGAVLRVEPEVDLGPPELFSRRLSPAGKGAMTDTTVFDRFYWDFSWAGWRFDAFMSLDSVEQMAAERLFDIAKGSIRLGPAFDYLARRGSFRPGLRGAWKPLPWLETEATLLAGIGAGGFGLGEAGLSIGLPLDLVRNIRKSGRDMSLRLGLDLSLVDFYGRLLPGCKAEASLLNYPFLTWFDLFGLRYLGMATAGISWNHADSLSRLPFEGKPVIYFKMGGSYYRDRPAVSSSSSR